LYLLLLHQQRFETFSLEFSFHFHKELLKIMGLDFVRRFQQENTIFSVIVFANAE